jgi:predicted DNA-binding protein (MmcQ/YjbR family)
VNDPLIRLRTICLGFPEAEERTTWGAPTFRIRDRIFAMVHDTNGRRGVWCKAPSGVQAILIEAAPGRFFSPPYVGPKGWIGVWLDAELDWEELAALIGRSYGMVAPKRLLAAAGPPVSDRQPARRGRPAMRRPRAVL